MKTKQKFQPKQWLIIIYISTTHSDVDNRSTTEEMNSHLQDNNREDDLQLKSTNLWLILSGFKLDLNNICFILHN